jgi:cell wall-associated NlpC family hydrolase
MPKRLRPDRAGGMLIALAGVLACSTACASTGAVPYPFPRPDRRPAPPSAAVVALDPLASPSPVVSGALALQGVPYRNGGADPSGFDCSGLVAYVFGQQGVWVPRTVSEQFSYGDSVDSGALAPGDLVFFTTVAPGASHVGIVVSGQEFVHAPSSSGVVRVEQFGAPYWASRYVGARRVR